MNVLHDNPGDFDKLAEVLAFTSVRFGPILSAPLCPV